ncbi:hypothetical protein ACO0M4_29990 [Streptomyces sp. RGM 3693]|uniref:hypothetical protein n=1 Tax=Streptomyces sp. RGM 3693 TaxID=3413284 RepID=UPI003D2B78A3
MTAVIASWAAEVSSAAVTRRLIEDHKATQRRRLTGMCERAGVRAPDEAAAEITFLMEGAQVSAQNGSVDRVGERLLAAVEAVLERGGTVGGR